jgi:hypothetical protein
LETRQRPNLDYYLRADMRGDIELAQWFLAPEGVVDRIWVGAVSLHENQPVYDDPEFKEMLSRLLPPSILGMYGEPAEVIVAGRANVPEEPDSPGAPFQIGLFHPESGFYVEYQGVSARAGGVLVMCPNDTAVSLWLWNESERRSLEEVFALGPNLSVDDLGAYLSLTDATGLDLESFAGLFEEGDPPTCLQSPARLWP